MKKKRRISFLILITVLFTFLFSGCFDSNAAKNAAEIYCSLILKSNIENINKIGVSDSDKNNFIKEYEDKIKEKLKSNVLLMQYSPSDEQLNSVYEGYKEALSKITYEVKQTSKSGNEAEVEILTTHFDIKTIDEQSMIGAVNEIDKMEFSSIDEQNSKLDEIYLNKFVENLKNAEVSTEKSSVKFKFKKDNKYWRPDDVANFSYRLVQLAANKENLDLNINEEIISPKESAEVFWSLVIKEDSSAMEKLGYSKALGEVMIKNMNKNDFKMLKNDLNKEGVSLSDDKIQGILNALRSAANKNSVKFEEVSKDNNIAQVKVSSTSINMDSIVKEAETKTKNQIRSNRITNEQKAIESYGVNLIDEINNAQVSSGNNEQTFNFTKVGNIWIPSNMKIYTESIVDMNIK